MNGAPISLIDMILRLLLAIVLGGIIGLEREFHGRPAGLRTHILVCLGATVLMVGALLFQQSYAAEGADSVFRIDPGRIAAGVVTGIGFLGAGAIIRSRELIRGLTTAACIWFVATLGVVVGSGLYLPAAIATLLGLAVLTLLDPVHRGIPHVRYEKIVIVTNTGLAQDTESLCRAVLADFPVLVQNTAVIANAEMQQTTLTLFVRTKGLENKHEATQRLLALPAVVKLIWE